MCHCRLAFVLIAVIVGLTLGACDLDSTDGVARPHTDSVVRRGNGGDPGSLDPPRAEDEHAFRVLADLYEGLVTVDAAGSIVAGVAENWSVSEDGLLYTFQLNPDARWSNGERVTADHFITGFRRTLEPGFASTYSFLLNSIRNAAAIQRGDVPLSELGVTAPDDSTLVIELKMPAPHFLSVLAMAIAAPLPPAAMSKDYRFSDPGQFVGNGPYMLQEWRPGHRVRLRKNPHFRDADAVTIENVEYYAVQDLQTELNMYRAGELDITTSVPGAYVEALGEERPTELHIAPKLGLYYLAFDLSEAPLDDPALRKALTMAIDRNTLVEIIGRGEKPAFGIVPDGIPGYEPARYAWRELSDKDREAAARQAFASSNHASDATFQIKLTYDVGDIHERVAVAVGSMWRDVLGIEVNLDKREWQYFLDTRDQRDEWQVMRFAWIGDYNHASTFTDVFRSESDQNLPGYRSATYDQYLAAGATTADADEQNESLASAESVLLADYAIAPLYFYVSKHLVSPALKGFENNALDRHPSRFLELVDSPPPE